MEGHKKWMDSGAKLYYENVVVANLIMCDFMSDELQSNLRLDRLANCLYVYGPSSRAKNLPPCILFLFYSRFTSLPRTRKSFIFSAI